jgi:hypothetical protein
VLRMVNGEVDRNARAHAHSDNERGRQIDGVHKARHILGAILAKWENETKVGAHKLWDDVDAGGGSPATGTAAEERFRYVRRT